MEAAKGAERRGSRSGTPGRTGGGAVFMRAVFRLDARVGSRWCLKIEPAGRPGGLADEAVRLRWLATTGPLGAHVRDRAWASRDGDADGGQRMRRAI